MPGSIADRSSVVNSKLQLRRDQMEDLNQVRELLVKLQAVFELPVRLRTAVVQGAVEIACDSYADAAPLLKLFGHKVIPAGLASSPCSMEPLHHALALRY